MPEGLHSDYLKGSSDYPLSGGKRGLGKDAFVPIEDLPGGESPEDILLNIEEGRVELKDEEEKIVVAKDKKAEVVHNPSLHGSRQGGVEVVGSRKLVLKREGVLLNTRDIKGQKRNDGRKPKSKN